MPLETISKLTVQTCRQSGLSRVYSELLQFDGDEMYFTDQPGLVGLTYLECQYRFATSTLVGIVTGWPRAQPERGSRLGAGEQLIVIAEDDSTIAVSPAGVPDRAQTTKAPAQAPERTLILGSHSQLPLILSELAEYSAAGSSATVVSDHPFRSSAGRHSRFASAETPPIATCCLARAGDYDHILVLAYRDHLDIETADSRTLITLLHLRELATEGGIDLNVVSEMLDDRNRRLAEVTKADDFIVSDNLISRMMAQISENAELNEVYSSLFSSDGAEIYLRPAQWYVQLDTPVSFYTVLDGAARRGETAIGYRDATPTGLGDLRAALRLNPPKLAERVFGKGDFIIVFGDDSG